MHILFQLNARISSSDVTIFVHLVFLFVDKNDPKLSTAEPES